MTSTQLLCRLTPGSMLDTVSMHRVRVIRRGQGYLQSPVSLSFRFQSSISNISPMIGTISRFIDASTRTFVLGSIFGGTRVTVDADGFEPGRRFVFLANRTYNANLTNITSSRIVFTPLPEADYIDQALTLSVIGARDASRCLMPSCQFSWATNMTPYFDSAMMQSIAGPTNLIVGTIEGLSAVSVGINTDLNTAFSSRYWQRWINSEHHIHRHSLERLTFDQWNLRWCPTDDPWERLLKQQIRSPSERRYQSVSCPSN